MKQFLIGFRPHNPEKILTQQATVDWLKKYLPSKFERYIDRFSVSPDYIASRALYGNSGIGEFEDDTLFSLNDINQPNLGERSLVAQKAVIKIFNKFYQEENLKSDHLIHVSCTHYQSPSAAQIVSSNQSPETTITHAYHMGCYASLPAIRIARGYNATSSSVDIVHTELCSLHIDRVDCSAEQIIMKTLFADGAIKYSSVDEKEFLTSKQDGLEVLALKEEIVPESEHEMTWKLTESSFIMSLSTRVPKLLSATIHKYMNRLFEDAGFSFEQDYEKFHFAIHPGGPKIIELIQNELNLSEDQICYSKKILNTRGNMSSATLPHIWNEVLTNETRDHVCSVAFGPGLTITGAIFKICRQ